jgi:hypothetical protein
MGKWKDEDIATPALIKEYLQEFKEGIENNSQCVLDEEEKSQVQESLKAAEGFCLNLLAGRKGILYMHDLILMTVGFYGGYLTAISGKNTTLP